MSEPTPIYDKPCSKCGRHLMSNETKNRNRLGDLRDHRVCPIPNRTDGSAER